MEGERVSSWINCSFLLTQTILVGDSGVGKTSLLVQFDTGTFHPSSFAATVGIGFTVSCRKGFSDACYTLEIILSTQRVCYRSQHIEMYKTIKMSVENRRGTHQYINQLRWESRYFLLPLLFLNYQFSLPKWERGSIDTNVKLKFYHRGPRRRHRHRG